MGCFDEIFRTSNLKSFPPPCQEMHNVGRFNILYLSSFFCTFMSFCAFTLTSTPLLCAYDNLVFTDRYFIGFFAQ